MKTLYDRLKPDLKEALEFHEKEYPIIYENLRKTLIKNDFWMELTISDAVYLFSMIPNKILNIENLINCFEDGN